MTGPVEDRLFSTILHTMDAAAITLGHALGYYRALDAHGPLTARELAERSGTVERYAREWLEQQAVGGWITASGTDHDRRFALPAEHRAALVDDSSLSYLAAAVQQVVVASHQLPAIARAFRDGGGVPWEAYGADLSVAQEAMNRPSFMHLLAREQLPSIPDVHARLSSATPARVADVGCGAGWSSIAVAQAYPHAVVDGFDLDRGAIERARRHAEASGVADRVRFHVQDAADPAIEGPFDLVLALECIHDLPRPVEMLAAMRSLAGDRGAVVVMDEAVAEEFTAPGDDVERLMYGFSLLICLPDSMSTDGSAAIGTVMRPGHLARLAQDAGFTRTEVLPIAHDLWRFYRLHTGTA